MANAADAPVGRNEVESVGADYTARGLILLRLAPAATPPAPGNSR